MNTHNHDHHNELHDAHAGHTNSAPPASTDDKPHTDPVCGMKVAASPEKSVAHDSKTYFFCSTRCIDKFKAEPTRYLHPAETTEPASAPAPGTIYTCPMHPEVRQPTPGDCPKCGMTLEPEMPTLDEGENHELIDFRRRFWWTLPLTVVVTVLAMAGHRLGWMPPNTQSWVELVLSLPVVLWAGAPFFVRGWQSVINRSPNMWTLISIGTGAAFVYSVVATLVPGAFPETFASHGRIGMYFEAAAVIISLTLLDRKSVV